MIPIEDILLALGMGVGALIAPVLVLVPSALAMAWDTAGPQEDPRPEELARWNKVPP